MSQNSKKSVFTPLAPKPVGPYSQAVSVGPWLFLSGQIPLDPETGNIVPGDISIQTGRVLQNMRVVLKSAGMDFCHVVKVNIFLTNMDHFVAVNEVYNRSFEEPFPARSCVAVAELPKGVDVEMEATAFLPEGN